MTDTDAAEDGDDVPYYPDLIKMAHKLVRKAVNRLDSVYRYPVMESLKKVVSHQR